MMICVMQTKEVAKSMIEDLGIADLLRENKDWDNPPLPITDVDIDLDDENDEDGDPDVGGNECVKELVS